MSNYLIEFRFSGYAKRYLKETILEVSKKFNVKGVTHKRVVPHITIFGPFKTNNERGMVSSLVAVARRFENKLIFFKLEGFGHFDNPTNKVIYADISPSEEMKQLRNEISESLRKVTSTVSMQDKKGPNHFEFHATIAFKDIDQKFHSIWSYMENKEKPKINQTLLRITIIKNGKILYEYDLIQKRLLTRMEAKNKGLFKKTIRWLTERQGN